MITGKTILGNQISWLKQRIGTKITVKQVIYILNTIPQVFLSNITLVCTRNTNKLNAQAIYKNKLPIKGGKLEVLHNAIL